MPDDQDRLPGLGPKNGPRTLRDLVDSHSTAQTSQMGSLLATPDNGTGSTLRLGFPSTDQLTRFVAGQHARLFSGLDLPTPLRHTAGGHLERKRFFVGGRIVAPDLVLTGPAAELVLVFTISPLNAKSRLPDPHSLELVRSLGNQAYGVLVTPEPDAETADLVNEYLSALDEPLHWVRYLIELKILD